MRRRKAKTEEITYPSYMMSYKSGVWEPPTQKQLEYLMERNNCNDAELAAWVGVSERTVRRWRSRSDDYVPMPYAACRLFLLVTGEILL